MKWHDVVNSELNGALAAVKYGHDPVAAKNLIEYFLERFRDGSHYNEHILLEFLDHAFGKIIEEGWSADHAFGLKLKRGHHERPDTTERDVIATAYMILLMRKNKNKNKNKNWTWLEVKGEAANLLSQAGLLPDGKGEKAVEEAYAFYANVFACLPDQALLDMLPPDTPVISRDKDG